MNDPKLLTAAEFNAKVRKWASEVKGMAKASLAAGTHGTGQLGNKFAEFVDTRTRGAEGQDPAAYKVKFGFDRYGVFRAYGVGRGWVRINGILVRGYRARSEREIRNKTWNVYTSALRNRGYSTKDINSYKFFSDKKEGRVRTQLDWLDQHINHRISILADYVQEFYGDVAMEQLLKEMGKIKIIKKGNNINIDG